MWAMILSNPVSVDGTIIDTIYPCYLAQLFIQAANQGTAENLLPTLAPRKFGVYSTQLLLTNSSIDNCADFALPARKIPILP